MTNKYFMLKNIGNCQVCYFKLFTSGRGGIPLLDPSRWISKFKVRQPDPHRETQSRNSIPHTVLFVLLCCLFLPPFEKLTEQ